MILIAAIAIGLLAAFLVFNYVQGAEDRANEDAQRVDVFVVQEPIPQGTLGDQAIEEELIGRDQIPQEFQPDTAVLNLDEISGKVSLANLAPGQVLVDGMFVDPTESDIGTSQQLDPDQTAITVSVDEIRGVAGLLVPGDEVNLLVTEGGGEGGDEGAASSESLGQARYLFQKVQILAVGSQIATGPTGPDGAVEGEEAPAEEETNSNLITFSVPADAAQLIAAVQAGQLYLTLVPDDYEPTAIPPLDLANLGEALPGEEGDALTPYGPAGSED